MTPMLIRVTGTRQQFQTSGTPIEGLAMHRDHSLRPLGHEDDDPQPNDLWTTVADADDQSVIDELQRRGFQVQVIQTGAERDQSALGRADEVNHDDGGGGNS